MAYYPLSSLDDPRIVRQRHARLASRCWSARVSRFFIESSQTIGRARCSAIGQSVAAYVSSHAMQLRDRDDNDDRENEDRR